MMKRIGIVLLTTAVFSLGAMETEKSAEELTQAVLRQAFELARTCKQLEAQKDVREVEAHDLPRTYLPAYGRQKIAMPRVKPKPSCIFCHKLGFSRESLDALPEDHVDKYAVVQEFDEGTVLFVNQMPYIDGHCLVMPKGHVPQLRNLSRKQRHEYHDVVDCAVPIFKRVFNVPGLNVGINEGEWAGASVPGHVHTQVIPRMREGFTGPLANTYVISKRPEDIYKLLKDPFSRLQEAFRDGQEPCDIDIDCIITG